MYMYSKWERCPVNYGCYNQPTIALNTLLSDRTTTLFAASFLFLFSSIVSYDRTHTYTRIHHLWWANRFLVERQWQQRQKFIKSDDINIGCNKWFFLSILKSKSYLMANGKHGIIQNFINSMCTFKWTITILATLLSSNALQRFVDFK